MGETLKRLEVRVNGEAMAVPDGITVAGLVALLELDVRKVAVERNLEIVPRSTYGAVALSQGDAIEIVQFVGGG